MDVRVGTDPPLNVSPLIADGGGAGLEPATLAILAPNTKLNVERGARSHRGCPSAGQPRYVVRLYLFEPLRSQLLALGNAGVRNPLFT